jgi:hypothetical protein
MLLKSKDDTAPLLLQLDDLLELPISEIQRKEIIREKKTIESGARAERDAAFEIDFRLKDHADWAIIHDLRLDHKGRVAQIDHLLLHPTNWEFYVVETKGIRTKVKVENGQWCFLHGNYWRGMKNPVEQNARHIQVLKEILRDYSLLPKTLGIPVSGRFINVVMVPPDCLIQQKDELIWVVHMDEFVTRVRHDFNIGGILRNIVHNHSGEHARQVGEKLISLHRPFEIDYRARFGISVTGCFEPGPKSGRRCDCCEKPISAAEASFCRNRARRFAGQCLCRKCQALAPSETPHPMVLNESPTQCVKPEPNPASRCMECSAPVDAKVVAFCRFNSRRFGKRILCRVCQMKAGFVRSAA